MRSWWFLLHMAWRQALREARSPELYTLFFAVLIAVASSSTIAHFAERLQRAMELRANEFLAADLVVSGSIASSRELIAQGHQLGLSTAVTIEFASMLSSEQGMQLASLKAVDDAYPLRGELGSSSQLHGPVSKGGRPAAGEIWLDAVLFDLLQIEPGDLLEVGAAELRASRVLIDEPDRAGGFAAFTPRAMLHVNDLPATAAIQPGSRVQYRQLWRGDSQPLEEYRSYLQDRLQPQQKIDSLADGNPTLNQALERARHYLGLASLAAILLASVSVALSAGNFAGKRYDHAALLRCFGLSRRHTLLLFLLQLLLVGLLASLAGLLLGWLAQHLLFAALADLLPAEIPPAGWSAPLTALFTGLASLLGFALPPLIGLGQVPPLRVLRRDLQPMPVAGWLVYLLALITLALLMWRLSLEPQLTLILLSGGLLTGVVLGLLVYLAFRLLTRQLAERRLAWRLGLGHLLQKPLLAIGQSLAFALILFAMTLIALLRGELLGNWQEQLPLEAPNHFAFNIMPDERAALTELLRQASPNVAHFYPMTPGRLTHINGQPVLDRLEPDSRALSTIQRDLNLTWSLNLPDANYLADGQWWQQYETSDGISISMEKELAERLHVSLGDEVSFNIGGQVIHTRVHNLRTVDWGSMQPNFFVIFAPHNLPALPHTFITSFYLPADQADELRVFSQQFPAVSLLRIDAVLHQLRGILAQVTLAVEFILLFVLAAGISVLLAGVQSSLSSRIRQGALLRALGGNRQLLRAISRYEFITLGATSGLLAWLACELASYLLYLLVFELKWQPHPWLVLLPPAGALLVLAAGHLGTRSVLKTSPMTLLRGS